jgi:5-methylcytosine-specific restriction endonuclease McrA
MVAGVRYCDEHRRAKQWAGGSKPASRSIPEDQRKRVLARDLYHCQLRYTGCTTQATHVDHRIALSEEGSHDDDNMAGACRSCHLKKSSREGPRAQGFNAPPLPAADAEDQDQDHGDRGDQCQEVPPSNTTGVPRIIHLRW